MNIKTISIILGIAVSSLAVSAAGTRGVIYLADNRYITQEAWIATKHKESIDALKNNIRHLEIKVKYNEATKSEQVLLEELKRDLTIKLKGN